jgi:sigma-E factor negative regulatory protein RseB
MRSHSNIVTVVFAFFLCLLSTNSFATDLFDMLKRMSDADNSQNYQGTFILRKSDSLSTLRVTHGVDDEGDWENLEALNGEPRKVMRRNNRVISVFPDREIVTIRHTDRKQSLHPQLPENIDQLELFYTMNRLDDDRIANHHALVVDLQPKDQYRYGYRYWVDKNTGMLLRCDLVTENKKVVEQMMFTSLDYFTEIPAQMFELQQFEGFKKQFLDEPEIDVHPDSKTSWKVERLPKGFMLTQSTMRYSQLAAANKDKAADDSSLQSAAPDLLHLVYSDGLASVSVFIEKNRGAGKHLQGTSSTGAVNAFGNPVGDHFVTVVGEVPVKTVQLMAKSTVKVP